jgi:hypothetical protein
MNTEATNMDEKTQHAGVTENMMNTPIIWLEWLHGII